MYKVRAIIHHQVHSYQRSSKNHFRRHVICPLTVHSLYGTDAGSQFGSMSTMLNPKLKSSVTSSHPRRIHRRRRYLYVDDMFFFCVGVLRSDHDLKCVMNACCRRQTTPTMLGALFSPLTCIAMQIL